MFVRICVILVFGFILEWKPTQSAPADLGKGKEKVRAYEFGFSIEEQQHRHEKRDENGIVMGEFGFITADGIYHVTVYATDENGKFKILAMKSYPYRSPEKKITAVTLPPVRKPAFTTAAPSDTKSCGGCVLPKKTKPPAAADVNVNKQLPDNSESLFRPLSKTIDDDAGPPSKGAPAIPAKSQSGQPTKPNSIGLPKAAAAGGNGKTNPLTTLQTTGPPKGALGQGPAVRKSSSFPSIGQRFGFDDQVNPTANKPSLTSSSTPQRLPAPQNTITQSTAKAPTPSAKPPPLAPRIGAPTPTQNTNKYTPGQVALTPSKTPTGSPQQNTNAPKTQTDTTKLTPLPQPVGAIGSKLTPATNAAAGGGAAAGAVGGGGGPLYRFNYILDYNSHREEGRIDGSKEGDYKAIDEGGIRRIVDYIANENGFQPHIKWERVPMSELPTGDNKLKEYEFVWFNKA